MLSAQRRAHSKGEEVGKMIWPVFHPFLSFFSLLVVWIVRRPAAGSPEAETEEACCLTEVQTILLLTRFYVKSVVRRNAVQPLLESRQDIRSRLKHARPFINNVMRVFWLPNKSIR
jgi:hypothetical protein